MVDGRFKVSPIYKSCSDIKKKIKPQSLAPTKNTAKYHFLRIHLQVIEWKTLMGVELNPLDWGWKLSNKSYEPIMTDLNAAPDEIHRFIRCNCSISKKSPCNTNVCSCKRHGLPCVSACGNCNGVECENSVEQEVSSDEDSVQSDEEQLLLLSIVRPREYLQDYLDRNI